MQLGTGIGIVSLNTWGGTLKDELIKFIRNPKVQFEHVLCFQEVYSTPRTGRLVHPQEACPNLYEEMVQELPMHQGYFFPLHTNLGFDGWVKYPLSYGLAIFVRRDLSVISVGSEYVHGHPSTFQHGTPGSMPRNLAYVVIDTLVGQPLGVANFHGLWNGGGKKDCPERIAQSVKVNETMAKLPMNHVLCGDFNLEPKTQSFTMLSARRIDLIREHNIQNTRSSYYQKECRYADYMLIGGNLKIRDFAVWKDEVSDHLPLYVKINMPKV